MARNFSFNYRALEYMMVQGVYYGRREVKKAANSIARQVASDINFLARRNLQGSTKALPNTFPVPRRSFDLYRSQKVERIANGVYRVYNDSKHAAPVHNGHRSYVITAGGGWITSPRSGGAVKGSSVLAWITEGPRPNSPAEWEAARKAGRARFAKSVRIPAGRRRPFLKLAVFQVLKDARTSTVAHAIALRAYEGFKA